MSNSVSVTYRILIPPKLIRFELEIFASITRPNWSIHGSFTQMVDVNIWVDYCEVLD